MLLRQDRPRSQRRRWITMRFGFDQGNPEPHGRHCRRRFVTRIWWLAVIVIGFVALQSCRPLPTPPPPPTAPPSPFPAETIPAALTATPEAARPFISLEELNVVPGAYVAWSLPEYAVPPTRSPDDPLYPGHHILGLDCLTYLDQVWPVENSISWASYDRCLNALERRKVKLPDGREVPQPMILTLPPSFMDPGGSGTARDPFIKLIGPAWMLNDTYRVRFQTADGKWYQTWRYDQAFTDAMVRLIRAAAERYDRHPGVSLVRLYVGFQGENQPVRACEPWWPGSPDCGAQQEVLPAAEKVVSCATYTTFVRRLALAAGEAFAHKPVAVMMSVQPCANLSGTIHRWELFDQNLRPLPVGYVNAGLQPDRPDAMEAPDKRWAGWRLYSTGQTIAAWGAPYVAEYAENPSGGSVGAQDRSQYMYWNTLMAAGSGARWVLHHPAWQGYDSAPMWEVVDYWLNSPARAWLVFRDREYPTFEYSPEDGNSGWIGDFARYLILLNPQDAPQACAPEVQATAQAANTAVAKWQRVTPACPGPLLPTPAITPASTPSPGADTLNRLFNRQARRLDPGRKLYIAASENWQGFGTIGQITVTVSYLDIGTTPFAVILPDGRGAEQVQAVPKQGSGLWKRFTWSQTAQVANLLDGSAFMVIANPAAGQATYLHEVFVDLGNNDPEIPFLPVTPTVFVPTSVPPATSTPSASPSPLPLATRTPTASATLSPTRTSTPTATRTPTPSATLSPTRTSTPTASQTLTPAAATTSASPLTCMPRPVANVLLGPGPKGIAAGEDGFFVGLFNLSQVARLRLAGEGVVWLVKSGPGRTNGLAAWQNIVVATNRDEGTVTLHDAGTGVPLAILRVGALPWGVAAANGRAYVANFGDNTVAVLDLVQRGVVAVVPVASAPVTAVADDRQAFVLHLDGQITQLDSTGRLLAQAKAQAPNARGLAWDQLRNRLYVGSQSGVVVALDASTLREVARFPLPGPAYALAFNPGTGRVFAVDAVNDRLYVIEPDGSGVGQLSLPPQGATEGGQGIGVARNRIAVANYAASSVSYFDDAVCEARLTPEAVTPSRTATASRTPTPSVTRTSTSSPTHTPVPTATAAAPLTPTPTLSPTSSPTPAVVRAKIEIVWPHGGASVREARLANITAYLLAGDGSDPAAALNPPPCDWRPTVRLWAALNTEPARPIAVGQKRFVNEEGRVFPAWDFNDVDVSLARDLSNKLTFFVTVDGVRTLHNIWVHAADARTLFPQQAVPDGTTARRPTAVDARIQIVWPHDNLPVNQARLANINSVLFQQGTLQAFAPDVAWSPTVRLHWALNHEPEPPTGSGLIGTPRIVNATNGTRFLAWDFNDVDVSPAQDALNKLFFWISVDGVPTYSNVWAHGQDARTIFPQPDVLNSCR